MSFKRFVFCLLLIAILVNLCHGKKEGKKKKQKKQKSSKNKNKKTPEATIVEELDAGGIPLVSSFKKTPYKMEEDKEFWPPGGSQRRYRREDSPQNNPHFMALYKEMRDAIVPEGKTAKEIDTDLITMDQQEVHFFAHRKMVEDLHVQKIYYQEYDNSLVYTIFAAHLDTKNGTDLPPIFTKNKDCSADICMSPTLRQEQLGTPDVLFSTPYIAESDYFIPLEETSLNQVTEDYLTKIENMLDIFELEDVKRMMCQPDRIFGVKDWLTIETMNISIDFHMFLSDPGKFDPGDADKNLNKAHDYVRGHMLDDLLNDICLLK